MKPKRCSYFLKSFFLKKMETSVIEKWFWIFNFFQLYVALTIYQDLLIFQDHLKRREVSILSVSEGILILIFRYIL